jgi:hypothetical protein
MAWRNGVSNDQEKIGVAQRQRGKLLAELMARIP